MICWKPHVHGLKTVHDSKEWMSGSRGGFGSSQERGILTLSVNVGTGGWAINSRTNGLIAFGSELRLITHQMGPSFAYLSST